MIVRYRSRHPFAEMDDVRRQLDTVFNEVIGLTTAPKTARTPAIELQDAATTLVLRALLPGVRSDAVDIQVTKETVSLSGTWQPIAPDQTTLVSEFRYGTFQRTIPLPIEVQPDQVTAELKDGVLTLTLPKVTRDRVVKVNLTGTSTAAATDSDVQDANEPPIETGKEPAHHPDHES